MGAGRIVRTIRDEDERARTVTLSGVRAIRATEKALLCTIDGKDEWVPQSQITDDSEVYEPGGEGDLVVTLWWAEKNGHA